MVAGLSIRMIDGRRARIRFDGHRLCVRLAVNRKPNRVVARFERRRTALAASPRMGQKS
jgi:hypothetical protein